MQATLDESYSMWTGVESGVSCENALRSLPLQAYAYQLCVLPHSMGLSPGSLEPGPSSPPDLRPSGRGPGKTSILFGEIRASASIFCAFKKSFALRSWSTGTCCPTSILKIMCTAMVCSHVGTFVMFYEKETRGVAGGVLRVVWRAM